MWEIVCIISVLVNVIFLLYVRWLLSIIKTIQQDLGQISEKIKDYTDHIGSLYELEMFYGEPTLQALMTHGKDLVQDLLEIDLVLNEEGEELEEG